MKTTGDIRLAFMRRARVFAYNGKWFEFIRGAVDAQGEFVEAFELGKNGQRKTKVIIAPTKRLNIKSRKGARTMNEFRLTIKTGNAAFEDDPIGELARILKDAARRVEAGETSGRLLDANGNVVGSFYADWD